MKKQTIIKSPSLVLLAGPNGAGKSTLAPILLKGALGVEEFVNADVIARGLSGFAPERVAIAAGRLMLRRIRDLARRRVNFAFETTLASKSFVPWIKELIHRNYAFHLIYLWLPSADFAVDRVRSRVQMGGHDVAEETVRRRYVRGLKNFFSLYQALATTWRVYDNSRWMKPKLIAKGKNTLDETVNNQRLWGLLKRGLEYER